MSALTNPTWLALSDAQRDALLSKYRDVNVDDSYWWSFIEEDFKAQCADKGVHVTKTYFSGFSSQGDGACFDGYVSNWEKFLKAQNLERAISWKLDMGNIRFSCKHRGHYYHENCVDFDAELELTNPLEEETDQFQHDVWVAQTKNGQILVEHEDNFIEFFRGLMCQHYKDLEDEYEHLTDDEQVAEWILECADEDELTPEEPEPDPRDYDPEPERLYQLSLVF